jgi:hypothetical protein
VVSEPLSPAAQAVLDAVLNETAPLSEQRQQRTDAAAFRAAAAQMIKTGDLTDTAEDIIRGAERHHQAGWLCTIAAELEGSNG